MNKSDSTDEFIWDSTNIGENYPGVTLPLTYSFIKDAYASVYNNFLLLINVPEARIEDNEFILNNMLGYIQGRVFYNIENWYTFLTFLPGYRYNKDFFESMLDPVKKKTGKINNRVELNQWDSIRILFVFVFHLLFFNRLKDKFKQNFIIIQNDYYKKDLKNLTYQELFIHYETIQKKFFKIWAFTIVNDFKVMILYGILTKLIANTEYKEVILREMYSIKNKPRSIVPLTKITEIVELIKSKDIYKDLFKKDSAKIVKELSEKKYSELSILIEMYLTEFGDRSANELKLEEPKFREKPELFIALIKQYVLIKTHHKGEINKTITSNTFKNSNPIKRFLINFVKSQCVKGIYNREYFRIQRGVVFGMARKVFLQIGNRLQKANNILDKKDIFYLYKNEIKNYIEHQTLPVDVKKIVLERKQKINVYKKQSLPKRIITKGFLHNLKIMHDFVADAKITGLGTSKGITTGEVIVVEELDYSLDFRNKILVTVATDPGWTVIFPLLKGVITEQGGVLSHASIVARELGIPCVVQVKDIVSKIKSGQKIQLNADKGLIMLQS